MLKGIPPIVTRDLLHALASMGHGDSIAIVDANFPSASTAQRLVTIAGASAPETLAAVLALMPLDTAVAPTVHTMEVIGEPEAIPEPVADFAAVLADAGLGDVEIGHLERYAFYERAGRAYAVVRTGELRPYGNILLVKGTVDRIGVR